MCLIGFPSRTYNRSFLLVLLTLLGTCLFPRLYALLVGQSDLLWIPKIPLSSSLTLRWSSWVCIGQSRDEWILARTQIICVCNLLSGFPMWFCSEVTLMEHPFSITSHPFWFTPQQNNCPTMNKKNRQKSFDVLPTDIYIVSLSLIIRKYEIITVIF